MKKIFLNKIIGIAASILTLSSTTQVSANDIMAKSSRTLLPESTSEERPVLFIDSASNAATDYLMAAHRSHSSHRSHRSHSSHYSSRGGSYSYPSTPSSGAVPSTSTPKSTVTPGTAATSSVVPHSTLVQEIQKGLVTLGHPLTVDGVYGTSTKKAIAMFQADHGLVINGLATQDLLSKINEEVKKR